MIKFNDNNIYVGYIKQLLHDFNLPSLKLYTTGMPLCDGVLYIKDNYIQKYDVSKKAFIPIMPYVFNQPILNYTKNLKISNCLYDSHTHEYLGEYLRFIRDYKKVNLMSLYNCFSNSLIDSLSVKLSETATFESDNKKYKIYAFPVKFFKKYTLAFSCKQPVEIICGFYTKSFLSADNTSSVYNISNQTYLKVAASNFKKPFIYDKLADLSFNVKELLEHEQDLKMFIKVPLDNNTSIVVLEGEYLNTNEKTFNNVTYKWENTSTIVNYKKPLINYDSVKVGSVTYPQQFTAYDPVTGKNKTVFQYYVTDQPNDELNDINYISKLQLLEINSNTFFPFSDRLIEYLLDNPVTKSESISDNIERIQEELIRRKQEGFDGSRYTKVGISSVANKAIWEDRYKAVLYDIANETGILDTEFDVLGYLDKDIEPKLGSDIDIYSKE